MTIWKKKIKKKTLEKRLATGLGAWKNGEKKKKIKAQQTSKLNAAMKKCIFPAGLSEAGIVPA